MKTTQFTCKGRVPVLHDTEGLHAAECQAVETKTVGTSSYQLQVTNPPAAASSLYWTDDDNFPLVEAGELIVWSA